MKTLMEVLTWAFAATSALAVIGTSARAAKDLGTRKKSSRVLDNSRRGPTGMRETKQQR
jgi:hypothetical protein